MPTSAMPDPAQRPKEPLLRQQFMNERVVVDGKSFVECTFTFCTFVYLGGPPPDLVDCTTVSPTWEFGGAAADTLTLLAALYHGFGSVEREMVERLFDEIRRSPPPGRPSAPTALE
jgi:hypothetical protein